MARADQRSVVADPLTSENDYATLGVYTVIDRPEYGFSDTQVQQLCAALFAQMDATFIGKLYGLQS
jgi:hypothetical protein